MNFRNLERQAHTVTADVTDGFGIPREIRVHASLETLPKIIFHGNETITEDRFGITCCASTVMF